MAISPPSDIVLDVANAANRADLEAARAELRAKVSARLAGRVATQPFEASARSAASVPAPAPRDAKAPGKGAFVQFEAMVLQTFMQSMLPENANSVYGEGLAGDMWKSLLAKELGQTMADRGGIGIADRMLADHYKEGEATIPVAGVAQDAARQINGERTVLSAALVQEMQRNLMQSLARDDAFENHGVTATGDVAN